MTITVAQMRALLADMDPEDEVGLVQQHPDGESFYAYNILETYIIEGKEIRKDHDTLMIISNMEI